ncbi:hypothetical protein E1301_Tti022255 [Triplophysa tibetana]|uniref:ISXO2-like transposase domain-containing protein n=1 Tax=Triplophysa tibetana TaxID=1572043 RepID=A0A5A9N710_9TELE|nr:hypothetical protein E1301_Tti022255 [Triplophysa tibetana]
MLGVRHQQQQRTGKPILRLLERRSRRHLVPLIANHVRPGSSIIRFEWCAYCILPTLGYNHYTVNHSRWYADPHTGAHTQHIERAWRSYKEQIWRLRGNRTESLLSDHLAVIEWNEWVAKKHSDAAFGRLIHNISRKFKRSGKQSPPPSRQPSRSPASSYASILPSIPPRNVDCPRITASANQSRHPLFSTDERGRTVRFVLLLAAGLPDGKTCHSVEGHKKPAADDIGAYIYTFEVIATHERWDKAVGMRGHTNIRDLIEAVELAEAVDKLSYYTLQEPYLLSLSLIFDTMGEVVRRLAEVVVRQQRFLEQLAQQLSQDRLTRLLSHYKEHGIDLKENKSELEKEDTEELEDEEVGPEQLAAPEAEETGELMERNGASSSATAGTDGGNPDGGMDLTGDLRHGPVEKPRQPKLKSYPRRSFGSQGQLESRGFSYSWFKQYQLLENSVR